MKKHLVSLFILISTASFSQSIKGIVYNVQSNETIQGANIILLNSKPIQGVSTDENGRFVLNNLEKKTYDLKVSYLGFQTIIIQNIHLALVKDTFLSIKLQAKINDIGFVEIAAKRNNEDINEMATVSVTSIKSKEKNHISGGLSDPQRIVLSFAGIKNQGDINNGISIRGNKATNMLWQLEGIEIQDPNHFTSGNSFGTNYINGAVSALNGNLLKNINLYTGAFPASYGNSISGVMDLSLRKGNDKTFEYQFNIGMLGLEATVEGPIELGGSFIVSYRYSTLDLVADLGFDVGNNIIGYRDLNYKINIPTTKFGTFTAFGLAGWSDTESIKYYNNKDKIWETTYNNSVFGFSHKINLSKKSYLKNILAFTQAKTHYHYFAYLNNDITIEEWEEFYYKKIETYRFSSTLHTKFNSKNTIVNGLKINLPKVEFQKEVIQEGNPFLDLYNSKFKNSTAYFQIFSQWKHKFNKKLSINSGMHFLLFSYNWNYSLEPRFSLEWKLHKKHTINFGTGLHSKIEFLPFYMAKFSNHHLTTFYKKENFNKDVELTKSFQISASYIYKPFKNFTFKIEPYLQYHFDVPIYKLPVIRRYGDIFNPQYYYDTIYHSTLNSSLEYYNYKLDNDGTGLNYGLELTAQKHFAKNYYFILASSFYRTFFKTHKKQTWQPTVYDGLFTFSASTGKDFKIGKQKKNTISLNARFLWSGGYFKDYDKKIRQKNYYKLDTRVAYILNKKKFNFTLALDVLNTTNHKNETNDYLVQGAGILPVLSVGFGFKK